MGMEFKTEVDYKGDPVYVCSDAGNSFRDRLEVSTDRGSTRVEIKLFQENGCRLSSTYLCKDEFEQLRDALMKIDLDEEKSEE